MTIVRILYSLLSLLSQHLFYQSRDLKKSILKPHKEIGLMLVNESHPNSNSSGLGVHRRERRFIHLRLDHPICSHA